MPSYSSLLAYKWSDGNFTYSFDSSNSVFDATAFDIARGYSIDNPDMGNAGLATGAMNAWSAVADINFTVDNANPEIGFYEAEFSNPAYRGHTAFTSTGVIPTGAFTSDVDLYVNDNDTVFGAGEKAFTYLHELGHALGLQHPNGDPNDDEYDHRSTVMSYEPFATLPTTPMIYDIQAIQEMYGANWSYNSNATTYALTSDPKLWTIWDADGNDTLDGSGLASNITVEIDIREGFDNTGFQYLTRAGDNRLYIAYGANIENANGNDGDNRINGNSAKTNSTDLANDPTGANYTTGNNLLRGLGGNDYIFGHGGNDTIEGGDDNDVLEGGAGADSLSGGSGIDTVSYEHSSVGVVIDLSTGYVYGGDATGDTLSSIENITGSNFVDGLSGTSGNDTLQGLAGNDYLYGGAGADSLDGGADIDTVSYNTSSAAVNVNLSTGTNTGSDAAGDVLTSIEAIDGSNYNDTLTGGSGSETLRGGLGNDILDGGAGNDFISGYDGDDIIHLNNNNPPYGDFINPGIGNDTIYADTDVIFSGSNVLAQVADDDRHFTLKLHAEGDSFTPVTVFTAPTSSSLDKYASISSGGSLNTLTISAVSQTSGVYSGGQSIVVFGLSSGLNIGTGNNELSTFLLRNGLLSVSADGSTYTVDFGAITTGTSANESFDTSANQVIIGGGGADMFVVYTPASYTSTIDDFSLTQGDAIDITRFDGVVTHLSDMSATDDYGAARLSVGANATLYLNGISASSVNASYFLSNTLDYGAGVTEYGLSTADTILGGSGNDAYYANEGNDSVNGHTGNDTLWGWTGNDTLYGSYGNDSIGGDQDNDLLYGDGGNDSIDGGDGNDTVSGGEGADSLGGGNNTDTLTYQGASAAIAVSLATGLGTSGEAYGDTIAGFENVEGSAFADTILGNTGANLLEGKDGADSLDGGDGNDTIKGGAGADSLIGGNGTDTLTYQGATAAIAVSLATGLGSAGEANGDTIAAFENIIGSSFADTITGSSGSNSITSGDGNDSVDGGLGNDTLDGGVGADSLIGGDGNDRLIGGAGADTLSGGNNTDQLNYTSSTSGVTINLGTNTASGGDAAGDVISGFEDVTGSDGYGDNLTGTTGVNSLVGLGGNDTLDGGNGNDNIEGGAGADSLIGGSGTDQLRYSFSNAGVAVNLGAGTSSGGDAAGDTISGFENVQGSSYADTITGDTVSNSLDGSGGNDLLDGGMGNDTLFGAFGNDTLIGGAGNDMFAFSGSYGNDTINDFQGVGATVGDIIQILGGSYGALSFAQSGADAIITSSGGTITLIGVTASSLTSADFTFA